MLPIKNNPKPRNDVLGALHFTPSKSPKATISTSIDLDGSISYRHFPKRALQKKKKKAILGPDYVRQLSCLADWA